MSTFLEICENTRRECKVNGTISAVTGQTGMLNDIVQWVIQQYTQIQNMNDGRWRWMRRVFTLATVAGTDSYAYGDCTDVDAGDPISRFNAWRVDVVRDRPKIYKTADGVGGETHLIYLPWDKFKLLYKIGTQNQGKPVHITVDPQDNLVLGPNPDDAYTITGDFWRSAQILAADGDEPEMPSQFHDLIMYRAMEQYALTKSAEEIMQKAGFGIRRLQTQLELNQLPKIRLGGPLC